MPQRLAGEVGVSTFDIFGLGTEIALDPLAFGFTNITDACGMCRQKDDYRELELSSFAVTKLAEDAAGLQMPVLQALGG